MTYALSLGRYQISVLINRKRGRSKRMLLGKLSKFISQLIRLAKDKRYSSPPVSRVLRRVFETKKVKQVFGLNLMAITLLTGVVSPSISAFTNNSEIEITDVTSQVVELTTERSVRMPVDSQRITQGYHLFHRGIDFGEALNSPVYPIMDGRVESVIFSRFAYGNHVIVNHGSGFKSLYAHFTKIIVKEDEEVDKNTVLGTVGTTGWATGPHLHLEVYDNDRPFNPLTILK